MELIKENILQLMNLLWDQYILLEIQEILLAH